MKTLCVMGGGRWSRVLMTVLNDLLSSDWHIHWVTSHGWDAARLWCQSRDSHRIDVSRELTASALSDAQGAIVATSPHLHFGTVQKFLHHQIPTLCEKPLVLDSQLGLELEKLAIDRNCPLGINLELTFGNFVEQFREAINGLSIHKIELFWHDPWSEIRYGETKFSDVNTNIIDDMFPHSWSLIRSLTDQQPLHLGSVTYRNNSAVHIELSQSSVAIEITLSRRGETRVRKISINGGEATLDFAVEPGCIELAGERQNLQWQTAKPLTRSLKSFLDQTERLSDWQEWPLSVCKCRDSFLLSTELASQLWNCQVKQLQHCLQDRSSNNGLRDRLILDSLLPLAARRGMRVNIEQPIEVEKFVQCILGQSELICSSSFDELRF